MTKKRRTKSEKVVAGSRKNNFDFVFDITSTQKEDANYQSISTSTSKDYSYIIGESKNTLLITTIIISVNLLLFIALKQGYINLFGIQF